MFCQRILSFCQFTWNNSPSSSLQSGLQHLTSARLEQSKGSTSCVHWCHQRYSDAPLHSPLFDVPLQRVCVPVSFNPPCAWFALTADERQSIDRSVSLALSPPPFDLACPCSFCPAKMRFIQAMGCTQPQTPPYRSGIHSALTGSFVVWQSSSSSSLEANV
jgi:hypothetical protein